MKFCENCGNQMQDTDNACSQCGTLVNKNIVAYFPKQNEPKESNPKAIVGLILGICSNLLCWVPILPVITSIVGIVVSVMGMKEANYKGSGKNMAIAGLVCCIVALCVGVLCTSCYMCFGCFAYSLDSSL